MYGAAKKVDRYVRTPTRPGGHGRNNPGPSISTLGLGHLFIWPRRCDWGDSGKEKKAG